MVEASSTRKWKENEDEAAKARSESGINVDVAAEARRESGANEDEDEAAEAKQ